MKALRIVAVASALMALLFGGCSRKAPEPSGQAVSGTAHSSATVYEVGGEVAAPVLIEQVKPILPEQYKHAHITQPLYIYSIVVSETGRVGSISLLRGSTESEPYISFERAFREAIAKWRYAPAMRSGKPVPVNLTVTATIEVQ